MDRRLIALLIVLTLLLSSCSMLSGELKEKIIEANSNIQTYESDMTYVMSMKMDIMGETMETETSMDTHAEVDIENQKMHMVMTMEDEMFGEMETESYFLDNRMYTNTMGQWMEMDFEMDLWSKNDNLEQSLDYLTSGSVKILSDEEINGRNHYVIQVDPDLAVLAGAISEEQFEYGEEINYDELFEEYSLTFWVDKKTFVISKTAIDFTMVEEGFEMDISMAVTYYNINKPLDITLPEEALNAPNLEDQLEDMLGDLDMDDFDLEDFDLEIPTGDDDDDDTPAEEPQTAEDCAEIDKTLDRNTCYWTVAVDGNNLEICLMIEGDIHQSSAITCLHNIDDNIGLSTQQVIDFCYELPEMPYYWQNSCFHNMADWRNEPGLCDHATQLPDTCVRYATE